VAAPILVDPALPFAFAWPDPVAATLFALYGTPGLGRLLRGLRRAPPPDVQVARLLSLCCADPSRVPARTVAQHVEMERRRAEFPDRSQALSNAVRSVVHTIGKGRGHAYRTIADSVGCPVLLLQGDRDRLVPVSVARSAARDAAYWDARTFDAVEAGAVEVLTDDRARRIKGLLPHDHEKIYPDLQARWDNRPNSSAGHK
jgi:pimeloyl-ACP methyl ester carboxylesterase